MLGKFTSMLVSIGQDLANIGLCWSNLSGIPAPEATVGQQFGNCWTTSETCGMRGEQLFGNCRVTLISLPYPASRRMPPSEVLPEMRFYMRPQNYPQDLLKMPKRCSETALGVKIWSTSDQFWPRLGSGQDVL